MGLGYSKYDQIFARPKKRLKTEEEENGAVLNVNNCSTPANSSLPGSALCERQRFAPEPQWNTLPYVALLEIYRMLPNNDKYHLSLTCKSWLVPFSRPALWRRGHFLFNGVDDWRAQCFASMMGAALRHVTADCSAPDPLSKSAAESAVKLEDFLRSIHNAQNCQLVTLELTNMRRMVKYMGTLDGTLDVISLLTTILKRQVQLQKLSLSHAGLDLDQGMQLLLAACSNSHDTVQCLHIEELTQVKDCKSVSTDPRFIYVMSRWSSLTELSLSHSYISDNLLFLLSATVEGRLELIKLFASYFGRADNKTSPEAWKHLLYTCPLLKVDAFIWGVSNDQTFCDILTPTIPLRSLFWNSGNYTSMVNTKICFDHITTHFQKHLKRVQLDLHYAFIDDEEDLASIVERCPAIETLSVKSKFIISHRQIRLERAIRRSVMRQAASQLRHVLVNDQVVYLEETWLTSLIGWLAEHVQ